MFAIEQCLLCLGHHPAVWHQAAHFLELSSKILTEKGDVNAAKNLSDEAATMFERATNTLLSKNMLLYFAHADFEEGRVKYEKVHQIYQKFLDISDIDPTLVSIDFICILVICWTEPRSSLFPREFLHLFIWQAYLCNFIRYCRHDIIISSIIMDA
jgi:tetratricopeptide (TPR) repeat protein